jgi:1-acyl-sn-glycerol-3-phosphate acyltransferase
MSMPEDIPIERKSKTSLVKLLKNARDRLNKGRVITMFPEGTRSRDGKMLPFKSGAKVVADKYKLRVQPVVLIQTAKYYDIKRFYYSPGTITVVFLESFIADHEDKEWLNNLRKTMQKVYDDELANNPSHR